MSTVRNWARGPFDLIVHAEGHLRAGEDIDRSMALISFDNAVEVSVTAYLMLSPIHRGNVTYQNADVEKWQKNYHTKLDFIEADLRRRGGLPWKVERTDIVWAHNQRNEQYHGGTGGVPGRRAVKTIREAAIWIFGLLFDVVDVEKEIEDEIATLTGPKKPKPQPQLDYDKAIDARFGMIKFTRTSSYYASDVLYELDHDAYKAIGAKLCAGGEPDDEGDE
ncbi:hypothetical protein [Sorangium sp. So ce117]|uniref:hypothetical protein n=1 Tax=Sorangium sp. So ce117 TaxID=3133277 RepID=UPI003F5DF768